MRALVNRQVGPEADREDAGSSHSLARADRPRMPPEGPRPILPNLRQPAANPSEKEPRHAVGNWGLLRRNHGNRCRVLRLARSDPDLTERPRALISERIAGKIFTRANGYGACRMASEPPPAHGPTDSAQPARANPLRRGGQSETSNPCRGGRVSDAAAIDDGSRPDFSRTFRCGQWHRRQAAKASRPGLRPQ
jgi:hypothetical protein